MDSILIWDSNCEPPVFTGYTVLWRSYSLNVDTRTVSIPLLIEQHSDLLKSRYLAWVYELGQSIFNDKSLIENFEIKPGSSYWWSTLIAEKSNWAKSPQVVDVIRFLAFKDWFKRESISSLSLFSENIDLVNCFDSWCSSNYLQFHCIHSPSRANRLPSARQFFNNLPLSFQAIVWFSSYTIKRWRFKGQGLQAWRDTKSSFTFVSYLFNLSSETLNSGKFESVYWGPLPDLLHEQGLESNWLHLFVSDSILPNSKSAITLIDKLNTNQQGSQFHICLDSFLSFGVLYKAICDWFRLLFRFKPLDKLIFKGVNSNHFWYLLRDDFRQSMVGISAIRNTLYFRLFERALKLLPSQSVCIYLQENTDWEFSLLQNWRAEGHGGLIGVPHTSVRYWDLQYFFDPRHFEEDRSLRLPRPDIIAVNGPIAKNTHLASGYPTNEIFEVEALRFSYLNKYILRHNQRHKLSNPSHFKLLVLGDYHAINNEIMMNILSELDQKFLSILDITVKPHPACKILPSLYPNLHFKITNAPICDLLSQSDVAFTSSGTSAALDAYCAAVPVISVLDPNQLNLSPLRGFDDVCFVSNSRDLHTTLHNLILSNPNVQPRQIFRLDKELNGWTRLLALSKKFS